MVTARPKSKAENRFSLHLEKVEVSKENQNQLYDSSGKLLVNIRQLLNTLSTFILPGNTTIINTAAQQ